MDDAAMFCLSSRSGIASSQWAVPSFSLASACPESNQSHRSLLTVIDEGLGGVQPGMSTA